MTLKNSVWFALFLAALAVVISSCSRNAVLEPWPLSTDPVVFHGAFGSHVTWQAFGSSKLDALSLDRTESHTGAGSLKLVVPASGSYAGGALTTDRLRNLSGYNAITFWAKASRAVVLDVAGFGNDNTGLSLYTAQRANINLTNEWTQYYIAVPNPARLTAEGGMFFVSEGPKGGSAFTFWIDDIQFVSLFTITNPRPVLTTQTLVGIAGSPLSLEGSTRTTFAVSGLDQTVTHMARYFDFFSSDAAVATPIEGGVQVVGGGTAAVTAKLAGVSATGTVTVNATMPPSVLAAAPTLPASSVISLFGSAYPAVPVDTWSASWDQADSATVRIVGSHLVKRFTRLVYAGVEFTTHPVDASSATALHLDVWSPSGTTFKVKLVDFGADGLFSGTDNSECELTFNDTTTPAFTPAGWAALEIPLDSFTTLAARGHLAQLILSSPDVSTVYVDNVYFHQ